MTRQDWAKVYVAVLGLLAVGLLSFLVYAQAYMPGLHPAAPFPWVSFLVLVVLAIFAEAYTINVAPGVDMSAGFLACFLGGAVVGPLGGFLIAVASQLPGLAHRQWERSICYTSTMAFVSGGSSLPYWAALFAVGHNGAASAAVVAAVGLGAGVLYELLNYVLAVPVVWLRRGVGFIRIWREAVKPFLPFSLFFLAISLGLISVYRMYLPANGGACS